MPPDPAPMKRIPVTLAGQPRTIVGWLTIDLAQVPADLLLQDLTIIWERRPSPGGTEILEAVLYRRVPHGR